MMFKEIYIILLVASLLVTFIAAFYADNRYYWIVGIISITLLVELINSSLHSLNNELYAVYAIAMNFMFIYFNLNYISNNRFRRITKLIIWIEISWGILFLFTSDFNSPIPTKFIVLADPLVISVCLLVLADLLIGKEMRSLSKFPHVLVSILTLAYFSLRFPYLILLNEMRPYFRTHSNIPHFFNIMSLMYYPGLAIILLTQPLTIIKGWIQKH